MSDTQNPVRVERHPSDEEIVAAIEKRSRIETRLMWTILALFAVMIAILFGGRTLHLPMELTGGIAFALLLVWVYFMFRTVSHLSVLPQPAHEFDENILRKTIDIQHRRWRWVFILLFFALIQFAVQLTESVLRNIGTAVPMSSEERFGSVFFAGIFAFFALLVMLQVCFGLNFFVRSYRHAVNDELSRAQQHRAAMFGYILSVNAMCGVMVTQIHHAPWGLVALPGTIAAVVILPGIYFLILQWRAGRDG